MIDVPAWSVLFGSMRFRPGADLDTGQIEDRRGVGSSLGGRGVAIGGGAGGLILILVIALLGGNPFSGGGTSTLPLGSGQTGDNTNLSSSCRNGANANQSGDCRIVAVVNSVQEYWGQAVPELREGGHRVLHRPGRHGVRHRHLRRRPILLPTRRQECTSTSASSMSCAAGSEREGGPFAEAYVIAHEYGHHVQNLLGTEARVGSDRQGPTSGSVRLELQADCYAGLWAAHAKETDLIESLTANDINDGLDAAAAVGDDRIQQAGTGRVDQETWTHGSARQRQRWFTAGYRTGRESSCDTFAADSL